MGTSSSNPGPKGKRSPNPPWAQEQKNPTFPDATDKPKEKEVSPKSLPSPVEQKVPDKSWSSPKRGIGDFTNNPSRENFGKLGRGYVGASGGSQSASKSARAGKTVTSNIAAFFVAAANSGLDRALDDFGLASFDNRGADSIASEIIETFAPIGATLEDAAARNALIDTMKDFLKEIDLESNGPDIFSNLSADRIQLLIELSISNYINQRMQIELLNRVERKSITAKQANKICNQLKKFIKGAVKIDLKNVDLLKVDWRGSEGKEIVDYFFKQAYSVLGDE